jgi:hypothetical protein
VPDINGELFLCLVPCILGVRVLTFSGFCGGNSPHGTFLVRDTTEFGCTWNIQHSPCNGQNVILKAATVPVPSLISWDKR